MKRLSFLLMMTIGTLIVRAQFNSEKDPYMTKSLTGQSIKNIEVETSGGSIVVKGGTGD